MAASIGSGSGGGSPSGSANSSNSSSGSQTTNSLLSASTGNDLGTILGHVVAVAVIAGLLYATAETPAYPIAIGILLVALAYVLLGNSTGVSRLAGDITTFAKL